ncbi:FAS-associated death domain protein [Galemys pyrenaicus]|uniref:FAS-associated death domain protein n=1 Tax=Galemys pyrenaicus TaxID=202257 RepID=A0A8J6DWM3_GALPY|nr:FAS-associated death domain protein [Galemys pyrenaicus]
MRGSRRSRERRPRRGLPGRGAAGGGRAPGAAAMDPFLVLLHSVSAALSRDELAELKFLCAGRVSKRRLERVQSGLDLFSVLLEQSELGRAHTALLRELLASLRRADLLRRLDDFEAGAAGAAPPQEQGARPRRRALRAGGGWRRRGGPRAGPRGRGGFLRGLARSPPTPPTPHEPVRLVCRCALLSGALLAAENGPGPGGLAGRLPGRAEYLEVGLPGVDGGGPWHWSPSLAPLLLAALASAGRACVPSAGLASGHRGASYAPESRAPPRFTALPPDLRAAFEIVCDGVGKEWRRLARQLKVSDAKIDAIEERHPRNLAEQARETLRVWKNGAGAGATVPLLVAALRACRLNLVADMVEEDRARRLLGESESESSAGFPPS